MNIIVLSEIWLNYHDIVIMLWGSTFKNSLFPISHWWWIKNSDDVHMMFVWIFKILIALDRSDCQMLQLALLMWENFENPASYHRTYTKTLTCLIERLTNLYRGLPGEILYWPANQTGWIQQRVCQRKDHSLLMWMERLVVSVNYFHI